MVLQDYRWCISAINASSVLEELAPGLTPVGTRPWVFIEDEDPT